MRKIRDSSIEEVAQDFWTKEVRKTKGTKQPKYPDDLIRSIHEAKHSYKLPRPANDDIGIWELQTKEEVLELKMRDDTLTGDWMDKRKLAAPAIPLATRTKLGSLAQTAIKLNYFEDPRFKGKDDDAPTKYYSLWKQGGTYKGQIEGSLKNFIEGHPDAEKTLIQLVDQHYEIIDGWGRLLPVATLLLEGTLFNPVRVYLAHPKGTPLDKEASPEA